MPGAADFFPSAIEQAAAEQNFSTLDQAERNVDTSSFEILQDPAPDGEEDLPGNVSPSHRGDKYTHNRIVPVYQWETGVLQFAIATDDAKTACRIFRVDSDLGEKVVEFEMERKGSWPDVPAIDETEGPLARGEITPLPPYFEPDMVTKVYRVRGRYVYLVDEAKGATSDSYPSATLPAYVYAKPGLTADYFTVDVGPDIASDEE